MTAESKLYSKLKYGFPRPTSEYLDSLPTQVIDKVFRDLTAAESRKNKFTSDNTKLSVKKTTLRLCLLKPLGKLTVVDVFEQALTEHHARNSS